MSIAKARRAREDAYGQLASSQMRKVDLGARAAGRWLIASVLELLDGGGPPDGRLSYAAMNMRRHVEARLEAVERQLLHGTPRLTSERSLLHRQLTAIAELAGRVDDAICEAIESGGDLSGLERAVLKRMTETVADELNVAYQQEVDVAMRQHWVDIGGSG